MTDTGLTKQNALIANVEVSVQSYRVGSRWAAKVETNDEGKVIGRAMADTREEAVEAAVDGAKVVLELRSATASLRASANNGPASPGTPALSANNGPASPGTPAPNKLRDRH